MFIDTSLNNEQGQASAGRVSVAAGGACNRLCTKADGVEWRGTQRGEIDRQIDR